MGDALDLEPIKAREAVASVGPWRGKAFRVYAGDLIVAACWRPWGPATGAGSIEADSKFIAAARTDVPALVAEVERLRDDLRIANEATLVLLARVAAGNGHSPPLTADERAALIERERARMAEPGYRDTLEDPTPTIEAHMSHHRGDENDG